jgi:hypothetical protein
MKIFILLALAASTAYPADATRKGALATCVFENDSTYERYDIDFGSVHISDSSSINLSVGANVGFGSWNTYRAIFVVGDQQKKLEFSNSIKFSKGQLSVRGEPIRVGRCRLNR